MEDKMRASLEGYIAAFAGRPEKYARMLIALEARPDYQKPIEMMPLDDQVARYQAMVKIRDGQRAIRGSQSWEFDALQLATLRLWPLERLQNPPDVFTLLTTLNQIHGLVDYYFKCGAVPDPTAPGAPPSLSSLPTSAQAPDADQVARAPGSHTSTSSKRHRQASPAPAEVGQSKKGKKSEARVYWKPGQRDLCIKLDYDLCVVTKTGNAQVCHVMPFAWNKRESNRTRTESFALAIATCFGFGSDPATTNVLSQLWAGLGKSDQAWNMICLSPTLHTWWSKGYFAFKWMGVKELGKENTKVMLQFRWMPRSRSKNAFRPIPLEKDDLLDNLDHHYGSNQDLGCEDICQLCNETNARCIDEPHVHDAIESGTIITVRRPTEFIDYFKAMIDLQWALIRVSAMSGAALAAEIADEGDDQDGDDAQLRRVRDWIDDVEVPEEHPTQPDD
ncbi:hypothetical protein ACJ41O_003757 [Fusarium nematophilum]